MCRDNPAAAAALRTGSAGELLCSVVVLELNLNMNGWSTAGLGRVRGQPGHGSSGGAAHCVVVVVGFRLWGATTTTTTTSTGRPALGWSEIAQICCPLLRLGLGPGGAAPVPTQHTQQQHHIAEQADTLLGIRENIFPPV